jgi:hypothetical protein
MSVDALVFDSRQQPLDRPLSAMDGPALAADIAADRIRFEPVGSPPRNHVDLARDWQEVLTTFRPSSRHWARVASAIHNADNLLAGDDGSQDVRGGRRWRALAVDGFAYLHQQGVYRHVADVVPDQCLADEAAIRTWLRAPLAHTPPRTVVDGLDPADNLGEPAHIRAALVDQLLAAAQVAGVFGLPGQLIELVHTPPITDRPNGLWLATRQLHGQVAIDQAGEALMMELDYGAAQPACPVELGGLLAGQGIGVERAVALLTGVADAINAALDPPRPAGRVEGRHRRQGRRPS